MTNKRSAQDATKQRWIPTALMVAFIYPAIGIVFAVIDSRSSPSPIRIWRIAAWVLSALSFGAHVVYEHLRLHSSPLRAALHVSFAVALGAFLLAVWVNVHVRATGSQHSPLAPLALVVFPLVTGIPAFLVAIAGMAVFGRIRRSNAK